MVRKRLHPLLLKIMTRQKMPKLHILNEPSTETENAIYVVNHSCRHDFPIFCKVVKKHVYVLVGKQRLDFVSWLAFFLNGVVYVDRKDKHNRGKASERIIDLLMSGKDVCMFSEGTWNLEPSKPMLPLYWGVIDIARNTQVPIVPIVLEYREDICYAKYGKPIMIEEATDKKSAIEHLADIFATLKWSIWEMFPVDSQ